MAKAAKRFKFEFGTDFQELILQYTVTDPKGYKVLKLYEDSYFTLIPHSIIAYVLKRYYKKHKNIPEEAYLREELRVTYHMDKIMKMNLSNDDISDIDSTINRIYAGPVKEPEAIVKKCVSFSRYISFKEEMEQVDINDYDSYEKSIKKLQAANTIGIDLENNYGTFLVSGMADRAHKRESGHTTYPTPFWQLNSLLNGGGTERGNVFVILSTEKIFKTGTLINTAIGYMRRRKKGFYVDLENGEVAIVIRNEQSIANTDRETIQQGTIDNKLLKLFRKYKRIGAELVVKKFASLKTTTDDIRDWLDILKRDFGVVFDFGIVDYGLLMGAVSGKTDDTQRISDAFLDLKNLADDYNLECLWTAAHTTREGNKRLSSKFLPTDTAKCMDITKHIDCLLGLQQSQDEKQAGVMRWEVLEGRNIQPIGKVLFWVDIPHQRMKEFSKSEVKEYMAQVRETGTEQSAEQRKKNRKTDL
jgi:hypothetical protein